MPVPNVFNVTTSATGVTVILPGIPKIRHRVRQVNIQNQSVDTAMSVSIQSYNQGTSTVNETIIGPVFIGAGQLLTIELASEESLPYLELEPGQALVISKADVLPALVFGYDTAS